MNERTATVSRRPRARARRSGGGRRRVAALLAGACAAAALAVAAMPLVRRAVSELGLPLAYSNVIRREAAVERLDPALIAAVIYAETKFDPRPSAAGARGLMQILPQTARYLARRSGATRFAVSDLDTPAVNIAYGSYYLRCLLDEYHGSEMLALAAYNGGETNVDRWLARARSRGRALTIAGIPFPQTRAYVLTVLQAQRDYRRTYASQLGYR